MLSRRCASTAASLLTRRRCFSTRPATAASQALQANGKPFPPLEEMVPKSVIESMHHAEGTVSMWYKINALLVVPILLGVGVWVYGKETAHFEHMEHHAPEFVPFEYMKKRKAAFPWGEKSLFHSDRANRAVYE